MFWNPDDIRLHEEKVPDFSALEQRVIAQIMDTFVVMETLDYLAGAKPISTIFDIPDDKMEKWYDQWNGNMYFDSDGVMEMYWEDQHKARLGVHMMEERKR